MPSQIFRVTRAPECDPVTPQQLRRMLWTERRDSDWDVTEMMLTPAELLPVAVHNAAKGDWRVGGSSTDLRPAMHRRRIGTNRPLTLAQAEAREDMAVKERDGNGGQL